eukprot:gene635-48_t
MSIIRALIPVLAAFAPAVDALSHHLEVTCYDSATDTTCTAPQMCAITTDGRKLTEQFGPAFAYSGQQPACSDSVSADDLTCTVTKAEDDRPVVTCNCDHADCNADITHAVAYTRCIDTGPYYSGLGTKVCKGQSGFTTAQNLALALVGVGGVSVTTYHRVLVVPDENITQAEEADVENLVVMSSATLRGCMSRTGAKCEVSTSRLDWYNISVLITIPQCLPTPFSVLENIFNQVTLESLTSTYQNLDPQPGWAVEYSEADTYSANGYSYVDNAIGCCDDCPQSFCTVKDQVEDHRKIPTCQVQTYEQACNQALEECLWVNAESTCDDRLAGPGEWIPDCGGPCKECVGDPNLCCKNYNLLTAPALCGVHNRITTGNDESTEQYYCCPQDCWTLPRWNLLSATVVLNGDTCNCYCLDPPTTNLGVPFNSDPLAVNDFPAISEQVVWTFSLDFIEALIQTDLPYLARALEATSVTIRNCKCADRTEVSGLACSECTLTMAISAEDPTILKVDFAIPQNRQPSCDINSCDINTLRENSCNASLSQNAPLYIETVRLLDDNINNATALQGNITAQYSAGSSCLPPLSASTCGAGPLLEQDPDLTESTNCNGCDIATTYEAPTTSAAAGLNNSLLALFLAWISVLCAVEALP